MANLQILDTDKVNRILERMAYEIWEKNFDYERIILVGIVDKGPVLAQRLAQKLEEINCNLPVKVLEIEVQKKQPAAHEPRLSEEIAYQKGDVVVVVDDVLYTGSTMIHAILPFLAKGFQKVQVAVLVFRDYLLFPIRPDFVGMALASTTQQHVEVVFTSSSCEAYLN